jgi:hypothetical protein
VRVIRDAVGDVSQNGQVIHANVRYQMDDKRRVAVSPSSKSVAAPSNVYEAGQVETVVKRKPCSCKGDASKLRLTQAWMSADKVTA